MYKHQHVTPLIAALSLCIFAKAFAAEPQTVFFPSADNRTELVAYVFLPSKQGLAPKPAVVMLHGRAGPYSSNVKAGCGWVNRNRASACSAATLSKRHVQWGEFWAQRGYLAIHVDSFGPRGKAHGFGRGTHDSEDRADVNELTVRPLDAIGALHYLFKRPDVISDRIYLQGWSNGASTAMNTVNQNAVPNADLRQAFRAVIALYPGCGARALVGQTNYQTKTRLLVLLGADDEEVSAAICEQVLKKSKAAGSPVEWVVYEDAGHNFDDPDGKQQGIVGNQKATEEAFKRVLGFFSR